ncbi:MAG: helix-turn-helix transcriptional regulator [Leptolyngbya sp. SIO1D8]|nr:helix-turn-helix transcriptional regulator [Leptolyngbya sp. SIO1D8]
MGSRKVVFVERRKRKKLTQRQVADAVGVDPRTVQRWESGETLPELTLPQVSAFCHLFECSVDDLVRDFYPETVKANGEKA